MSEPIKFPEKPRSKRVSRWDKNSRYNVTVAGEKVYTTPRGRDARVFMDGWNACAKEIAWLNKERYE